MNLQRRTLLKATGVGMTAALASALPAAIAAQGDSGTPPAGDGGAGQGTAPTMTVEVGDIQIAYRIMGQGQPLVLIMGFRGTMDLWDPTFLGELAKDYLVITFDNRGMGQTTATGDYPFEQLADDTAGFIRALGLSQPSILGYSMGAYVALDLANRYADQVGRIVLYAGDCGGDKAVPPDDSVVSTLNDTSGSEEEQGRRLLRLLFPQDWLDANMAYVMSLFNRPMSTSSPENIARQAKAIDEWGGVYDALPAIEKPALVVQGMADVVVPPENATILADRIPGSWLIRLPGLGHGLLNQEPKRIARLTREFVSGY